MALEMPKSQQFINRYNEIQPREGVFRLRRLLNDAKAEFLTTGDVLTGTIWANCEMDLGNIKTAEKIFNDIIKVVPLDPKSRISLSVYISYARFLGFTSKSKESAGILDKLTPELVQTGIENVCWAMDIYASAGQKEKVIELQRRFMNLFPQSLPPLTPGLLFYQLESGDVDGFMEGLFAYAKALGFTDTNLDNLEQIIDKMADFQTHPGAKPNLLDIEFEHLEKIKEAAQVYLTEEELWEQEAGAEAERRLKTEANNIISFQQVSKDLGLDSLIR